MKVTVDGIEVEVEKGATVLQACEAAGVEVPVFCYHPRLNIAGNCRMCLVEVEQGGRPAPKPQASCALPAADGMVVKTTTEMVQKARKGVLEMLLINHPLDCPICDQGGECDLQDLTLFYGPDQSRFQENKRPVTDKYMGPLISTHMTRCIHCTRCIRFINEVAGIEELGAVNRGEDMEISTWVEQAITSELSGNIADICPVGALNSKPFEYRARTWELKKTESIDVLDAVGTNIRLDTRGSEVMRVLPRLHEEINEEWLADKSRAAIDGLKFARLDTPFVKKDGKLQQAGWPEAFAAIKARMDAVPASRTGVIVGDQIDLEAMTVLKDLTHALGITSVDCRQDGAKLDAGNRASYLFNTTIAGIERADACLLIGTNPRYEAPLVNARLRKRYRMGGGFKVGRIGAGGVDLTYPVSDLGAGTATLRDVLHGNHGFCDVLRNAQRPMLILGQGALARRDGAAVVHLAQQIAETYGMIGADWNGFSVLHTAAARVGGLDLGLVPGAGGRDVAGILEGAQAGDIETVFLLGADEIDTSQLGGAFVIYQGHHGDVGARAADVILPGAAYTEKNATYVNTEGRPQRTRLAAFAPGLAREDWKILRALSEALGHTVPVNTLADVRARMVEIAPHLAEIDSITPAPWSSFGLDGPLDDAPFESAVKVYYQTCAISRASKVMQACVDEILRADLPATGTEG